MNFKRKLSIILSSIIISSIPLNVTAVVKGDVNGDGSLNIRDAAFIARSLAIGTNLSDTADFNGDGTINIRDAAAIANELTVTLNPPVALSMEEKALKLVNEERAKYGIAPLTLNSTINQAANIRTKELLTLFSHTRPDGSDCFTVFNEVGLSPYGAENIAAGNSTVDATIQQWIDSSGHHENMINSDYTQMGIAYVYSASAPYRYYWVQLLQ